MIIADLRCAYCSNLLDWEGDGEFECTYCGAIIGVELETYLVEEPIRGVEYGEPIPARMARGADAMGLSPFADVTGRPMWDCIQVYKDWRNWIGWNYMPGERLVDSISRYWRAHGDGKSSC